MPKEDAREVEIVTSRDDYYQEQAEILIGLQQLAEKMQRSGMRELSITLPRNVRVSVIIDNNNSLAFNDRIKDIYRR